MQKKHLPKYSDDPGARGVFRREPFKLKHFDTEKNLINGKLRGMGMEVLLEAEIVGSRMYTGPMYFIYNAVLRTIGNVEMDESGATSAAASGGSTEEAKNKALRECVSRGDRYTTTLHVINSSIVKLSKIVPAEKVYRGVSGMLLPPRLQEADSYNVKGGIEFAFLSCTRERSVALEYATRKTRSILLEMTMGMLDRGADLSWLSQYPHEKEVLFGPLTGIEVTSTRVESDVLVVSIRPSANVKALTIEQVIATRKTELAP